ncbi:MBL fold metallo-hydrolase [Pantoea sp.]|uniref:MBL fold metallo-hydrolase n=1 Tax=Pantoea sp. TaxID=69393 RepID=UPI0039183FED
MSLNIYPLNLGNITLDKSGLVLFQDAGVKTTIPTLGFLITGGEYPVLVDTGSRSTDYYRQFGFEAEQTREMTLAWLLAQHGLKPADIRYVIHTHAHVDHAGGDYLFPVPRRFACRGVSWRSPPPALWGRPCMRLKIPAICLNASIPEARCACSTWTVAMRKRLFRA